MEIAEATGAAGFVLLGLLSVLAGRMYLQNVLPLGPAEGKVDSAGTLPLLNTSTAAVYALGHGAVKGSLFLCAGVLLHRYRTVDDLELHGRARRRLLLGAVFALGGLGLAGLPPFGTYLGESAMDEAAEAADLGWLTALFAAVSVLTG